MDGVPDSDIELQPRNVISAKTIRLTGSHMRGRSNSWEDEGSPPPPAAPHEQTKKKVLMASNTIKGRKRTSKKAMPRARKTRPRARNSSRV